MPLSSPNTEDTLDITVEIEFRISQWTLFTLSLRINGLAADVYEELCCLKDGIAPEVLKTLFTKTNR